MDRGRVIRLHEFSPGMLEQFIHAVKGHTSEIGHRPAMDALVEELEERYTRLEEEVPGWHR